MKATGKRKLHWDTEPNTLSIIRQCCSALNELQHHRLPRGVLLFVFDSRVGLTEEVIEVCHCYFKAFLNSTRELLYIVIYHCCDIKLWKPLKKLYEKWPTPSPTLSQHVSHIPTFSSR